ncbi:MAG: hypothetical protein KME06_16565 [Kastovskya adunca ATA6-11-RM4]|jgi:hypothetical protein|nr:hypothetical protein [Kastovskya adunca ATA6-11-RM4]
MPDKQVKTEFLLIFTAKKISPACDRQRETEKNYCNPLRRAMGVTDCDSLDKATLIRSF